MYLSAELVSRSDFSRADQEQDLAERAARSDRGGVEIR